MLRLDPCMRRNHDDSNKIRGQTTKTASAQRDGNVTAKDDQWR